MFLYDHGVLPRSKKYPFCGHYFALNTESHGFLLPVATWRSQRSNALAPLIKQYIHLGTTIVSDSQKTFFFQLRICTFNREPHIQRLRSPIAANWTIVERSQVRNTKYHDIEHLAEFMFKRKRYQWSQVKATPHVQGYSGYRWTKQRANMVLTKQLGSDSVQDGC